MNRHNFLKFVKKSCQIAILLTATVYVSGMFAAEKQFTSVIGKWVTFDEKTHKASSVIGMSSDHGVVTGKILAAFPPKGQKPMKFCRLCRGALKNKPMIGLTIIQGMQCDHGRCHSGRIVDPRDGQVYHAKMQLADHGRLLKVRGYVGLPLFGKTVVWKRFIAKPKVG